MEEEEAKEVTGGRGEGTLVKGREMGSAVFFSFVLNLKKKINLVPSKKNLFILVLKNKREKKK